MARIGLAEEPGNPVGFTPNLGSLFALAVFDEGFLVRGGPLVGHLDGISNLVPEVLGLAIGLLGDRAGLDG